MSPLPQHMHTFKNKFSQFAFCSFIEQQNKSDHMRASSAPQWLTHYVLTMSPTGQWCQSGHQENSLPGPLLRQPHHHHPQLPTSFKSLRCCHSEHARAKRAEVWGRVLYPSRERAPVQSLSVQVSLCEGLCHSALSGTSHSTQPPRSLQHCSTLTAWETQTEKEERGEEGVT